MIRLGRKIRKWFYIETVSVRVSGDKFRAEYIVWYPSYVTIPIFGYRYTFITGLSFHLSSDISEANDFMEVQKLLYKLALIKRRVHG
jgi:hypothetical protein